MPPKGLCVGEQVEGGLGTHPCAGVNMIEVYLQLDTEEKLLGEINGLWGLRLKTGGCRGPGILGFLCCHLFCRSQNQALVSEDACLSLQALLCAGPAQPVSVRQPYRTSSNCWL